MNRDHHGGAQLDRRPFAARRTAGKEDAERQHDLGRGGAEADEAQAFGRVGRARGGHHLRDARPARLGDVAPGQPDDQRESRRRQHQRGIRRGGGDAGEAFAREVTATGERQRDQPEHDRTDAGSDPPADGVDRARLDRKRSRQPVAEAREERGRGHRPLVAAPGHGGKHRRPVRGWFAAIPEPGGASGIGRLSVPFP